MLSGPVVTTKGGPWIGKKRKKRRKRKGKQIIIRCHDIMVEVEE
jgi:hypothetical protein